MGTSLQTVPSHTSLAERPEIDVEYMTRQVLARVKVVAHVKDNLMKQDVHYGKPPGMAKNAKDVLLKPGAETLLMAFQIAPRYVREDLSTDDAVHYRITAIGFDLSGRQVGEGLGECSSNEEKYRWRKALKQEFEGTPEERRREKWRKGWDGKADTKEYQVRTNPADVANTIYKMASKRALVHLAVTVTACSDMFDQDLEDLSDDLRQAGYEDDSQDDPQPQPAKAPEAAKAAETAKAQPKTVEGVLMADDDKLMNMHIVRGKARPEDMTGKEWDVTCKNDMKAMYKVDSSKELTMKQANELMAIYAKMANDKEAAKKVQ